MAGVALSVLYPDANTAGYLMGLCLLLLLGLCWYYEMHVMSRWRVWGSIAEARRWFTS
jgi:hypothetical protein